MRKTVVIGLAMITLLFGISAAFAQQQGYGRRGGCMNRGMNCPMVTQTGSGQGTAQQDGMRPRMRARCPLAAQQDQPETQTQTIPPANASN